MNRLLILGGALLLSACQQAPEGNGAEAATTNSPRPSGTLADALSGNGQLLAAMRSAGLEETLKGPGPYTLLAPTDAAFGALPQAERDSLMKPEGRERLTGILTYHVLPGTILAADIAKAIEGGNGKAALMTMSGKTLTATREGERIVLADQAGGKATITGPEKAASNGVLHQVDRVLMPGTAG